MSSWSDIWKTRKYHLDRMTLRELTTAYFQYPAIQAYIVLLGAGVALALRWSQDLQHGGAAILTIAAFIAAAMYPMVWYLLHRFVLHGRFLYRSPKTAALWKRIHYDHHRDPNDLRVLFGALHTTLPAIAVVTIPIGVVIGNSAGAAMAFSAAVGATLFYEYCHCIQHLRYAPRSKFLRRIKRLHLLHHFYNEQGNYGITNFWWDRVAGTYYSQAGDRSQSETVFNLGYDAEEYRRYPWVAQLSETPE